MSKAVKPSRKKVRKAPTLGIPETVDDVAPTIVERPDGYYWTGSDAAKEFGPYESYELAQAARDAFSEEAMAPSEALLEAEREIGIADWIDVETGEPAEGQSPPHLQED